MVSSQSLVDDGAATLDGLGLKALELMQQIVTRKLKLQDHIKAGSINLAKSRYIMGNRSVSLSQLPTEDSEPFLALHKVEHSVAKINGVETTVFTSVVNEPQKKRKSDKHSEEQELVDDLRLSCDPLHWFGVLVPLNLRIAQESFKKAVELSIELATLQVQLEALRLEFCTLKLEQIKLT